MKGEIKSDCIALYFKEVENGHPDGLFHGHRASRFHKIHPHTPDEEDEETLRLLNQKLITHQPHTTKENVA